MTTFLSGKDTAGKDEIELTRAAMPPSSCYLRPRILRHQGVNASCTVMVEIPEADPAPPSGGALLPRALDRSWLSLVPPRAMPFGRRPIKGH